MNPNKNTALYNSCSVVVSVFVWTILRNNLVAGEKSAFWLLLFVIGFIEAMAFIASAGVEHARWQVHVVQSVLYVVGIGLGGVGTFAVQIAKSFDAEVTAVTSPRNLDQVRALGADHVIDYTREDFTRNGQHYDLILAANGYHPISDYKRALTPRGIYVMAGGTATQIFQAMLLGSWSSEREGKKMGGVVGKRNQKDLTLLKELIEAGKVRPVIDRCYPLSETAEALRYLGTGHARGKIVITVGH